MPFAALGHAGFSCATLVGDSHLPCPERGALGEIRFDLVHPLERDMNTNPDLPLALEPAALAHGVIIGLVDDRQQFQALFEAVSRLGVHQLDVSASDPGINYLESEHETMAPSVLLNLEAEMVTRFLSDIDTGSILFAALLEADEAPLIAEAAIACGATQVVHVIHGVATRY